MHVYISPIGRVASQMLSSLTMTVMADTYLFSVCSVCAYNYQNLIVNFHSRDNMRIDFLRLHNVFILEITWELISYVYTVFYRRQSSVLIASCRASSDWKNICGKITPQKV